MAVFRPGHPFLSVSGRIGTTVFRRKLRNGVILTRPPRPRRPTQLQSEHRNRFARVTAAWSGLTENQRADWREYAADVFVPPADSEPMIASGFNRYVGANLLLDQAGEPGLVEAPVAGAPIQARFICSVDQDVATNELLIRTYRPVEFSRFEELNVFFLMDRPTPVSRSAYQNTARYAGAALAVGLEFPFPATGLRIAAPYELRPGTRFGFRVHPFTTTGAFGVRSYIDTRHPEADQLVAFRFFCIVGDTTDLTWEVTADRFLIIRFVIAGTPTTLSRFLGVGGSETIGALRSWVASRPGFAVFAEDFSLNAASSDRVAVAAQRGIRFNGNAAPIIANP